MSTRCHIEFKRIWNEKLKNGKVKKVEESRMVYRHSDGYPEGVVPDLKEFLEWNDGRNSDLEYMTANFIYWSKRWHEERYYHESYGGGMDKDGNKVPWHKKPQDMNSMLLLGFGVCEKNGFHGDMEYFYEVIVKLGEGFIARDEGITIKVYDAHCVGDWAKGKERKDFKLIDTIIIKEKEGK